MCGYVCMCHCSWMPVEGIRSLELNKVTDDYEQPHMSAGNLTTILWKSNIWRLLSHFSSLAIFTGLLLDVKWYFNVNLLYNFLIANVVSFRVFSFAYLKYKPLLWGKCLSLSIFSSLSFTVRSKNSLPNPRSRKYLLMLPSEFHSFKMIYFIR